MKISLVAALTLASFAAIVAVAASARDPESGQKHARAPAPAGGTNEACCAKLAAIDFKSNIPVVVIDTLGVNVTRTERPAAVCTCSHGLKHGDWNGTANLRNRLLQYAVGFEKKENFLGMPKSKKWILYAQQVDPFGLNNWFGFNLSRATGEYAARSQFCEVFVNIEAVPLSMKHYRGIYVGLEKPRQEDNRVNISANNDPKDISGGYMLQYKHSQNPKLLPTINGSVTDKQWNVEYPQQENITEAQVDYIQEYLNQFEEALYGPNFASPQTGWRKFANETAFRDWFITSELIRNVKHTYHSSAFLTKDAGKPFIMGPVWNNVQGFGTCCGYPVNGYDKGGASPPNPASGGTGVSSSGWLFTICLNDNCLALDKYAKGYGFSTWFQQLWKDPEWVQGCARRYAEMRAGAWSDQQLEATVASLKPLLQDAAIRTLARWEKELRQPEFFPTPEAQFDYRVKQLADWTISRARWMDAAFKQALVPALAGGPYPSTYPPAAPIGLPTLPATAGK